MKRLLLVLALCSPCFAQIAIDGSPSLATPATASSLTWSHTIGVGSNRILIVTTEAPNSTTSVHFGDPSSVTYGGVSLTQAILHEDTGGDNVASIWYLVNPTSGTDNIIVTFTGSTSVSAEGISLTGVDQVTPLDITPDWTTTMVANAFSLTETVATSAWIVIAEADQGQTFVSWGNGDTSIRNVPGTHSAYNGPKSGLQTEVINLAGFTQGVMTIASFKPAAAPSGGATITGTAKITGTAAVK